MFPAAAVLALLIATAPAAEEDAPERYSVHYQATVATQAHPSFSAPYTGRNSMVPDSESATSVVSDLFLALRVFRAVEIYAQPELVGGSGLSKTLGVAAFPSGEVYRVGNPSPNVFVGRAFARVTIGLGGGTRMVEKGPGQLGGTRDADALTLTAGKVAVTDFVDSVELSNDPHTRFMSWGLWASAAYDYPADTHGYTWGIAADLALGAWSGRAGIFLEPQEANGIHLEWDVGKARGIVAEIEHRYGSGAVRALAFFNTARMGSYRAALDANADVTTTREDGRTKAGFAASANQDLGEGLGAFLRLSWNDGRNETWAFTEIDRSAAAGLLQSGARWGRPLDEAGLAFVASDISQLHAEYLASGQYGFLIGDGALRRGPEMLGEIFYRLALSREVSVGGNYQPIVHPAYNRDRGPIHVFTARAHVAF